MQCADAKLTARTPRVCRWRMRYADLTYVLYWACVGTLRRGVSRLARAPVPPSAPRVRLAIRWSCVDRLSRAVPRACRQAWRHLKPVPSGSRRAATGATFFGLMPYGHTRLSALEARAKRLTPR